MYRARVEVVDGLRVRAGGKWLTCIGNKNVRVGELIWTDGRCVYGYYKDSSQPIVITNPPRKIAAPITHIFTNIEEIIPIQNGNSCGYFSDKFCGIGNLPTDCKRIVNNNKKILFSSVDTSDINIYTKNAPVVLSANCDKMGNVFEFAVFQNAYICITKNQNEIKKIPLGDSEFVICGFIEDIDNWAYISYRTEYTKTVSEGLINYFWLMARYEEASHSEGYSTKDYFDEIYINNLRYYGDDDYSSYTYEGKMTFVDSQGFKIDFISFDCTVSREWRANERTRNHFNADHIDSYTFSYDNLASIKFPMHDGFYFTMQNPIMLYRDVSGFPVLIEKNIFSPDDKKIFSDYFGIQTNFLAALTKGNSYLIVPFNPDIYDKVYMGTLEGNTALTKQLAQYDIHPYGHDFWADFDYSMLYDETAFMDIARKVARYYNEKTVFLVDSDGNTHIPDWQHLGFNLRKLPKTQLAQWFKQFVQ